MKTIFSWLGIGLMRMLAPLPLTWIRSLGRWFGYGLYVVARSRREVVKKNLFACMPDAPESTRRQLTIQVFVYFAQAWLDRSWLWYGSERTLERRLHLCGEVSAMRDTPRLVLFAPHFHGLEAGALAINLAKYRSLSFIYTPQANSVVDQWMLAKRQRFGGLHPFLRGTGVSEIVASIKSGTPLHLSCDMDFGAQQSEFIPFFGVPCATVTSLSRFARLSRASVMSITNSISQRGYDIELSPIWSGFPSADAVADTRRMNTELEALIRRDPAQYYWVHKRFKTRPSGEASIYSTGA